MLLVLWNIAFIKDMYMIRFILISTALCSTVIHVKTWTMTCRGAMLQNGAVGKNQWENTRTYDAPEAIQKSIPEDLSS